MAGSERDIEATTWRGTLPPVSFAPGLSVLERAEQARDRKPRPPLRRRVRTQPRLSGISARPARETKRKGNAKLTPRLSLSNEPALSNPPRLPKPASAGDLRLADFIRLNIEPIVAD